MSAAALEALRKKLPRGMTAGQNGRTYREPTVVDDKGSVFSQEDPPLYIKKQVPSIRDIAVQAD